MATQLVFIMLAFISLTIAKKIGVFHVTKGSKYRDFQTVVNHREDLDFAN